MQDFLRQFQPHSAQPTGHDLMVFGEVVRAMNQLGYPSVRFWVQDDRQLVRFRTVNRTDLTTVTVHIDGASCPPGRSDGALPASVGLRVVGELRDRTSTRSRQMQTEGPLPTTQEDIRVERQLTSFLAHTTCTVVLDDAGAVDPRSAASPLRRPLQRTVERLAEALTTARETAGAGAAPHR